MAPLKILSFDALQICLGIGFLIVGCAASYLLVFWGNKSEKENEANIGSEPEEIKNIENDLKTDNEIETKISEDEKK